MRWGLINKTAVTPANIPDFKVVDRICPREGLIFMDKLYDTKRTDAIIRSRGGSPGTIRKNNNPGKNFDLDRWRSAVRMPFEGTFASLSKRARYRSLEKIVFQNFLQSICFNLKKAICILPNPAYT